MGDRERQTVEILLIEDNPADAALFVGAMSPPHTVTVAHTGAEALDLLFRRGRFLLSPRPDVVVVDLSVPILNGHEVINVIKSNSLLRAIPVVVYSGSSRPDDVARAYDLGAGAYITKPASLAETERALSIFSDFWTGLVLYTRFANHAVPATAASDL